MNGTRKPSSSNRLRQFIEESPLLTLCAAIVTISGVVFSALSWMYTSKYEVEIARAKIESQRVEDGLKRQYSDKEKQLDDERSRIRFVVENQSSFLDLKSLIVNEEQLGADYKKFRSLGFAVPISAAATAAWTWKETNEFDRASEVFGQTGLSKVFSDPESLKLFQEASQRVKLYLFESPTVIELDVAGSAMKLGASAQFQSLAKADLDYISAISHLSKNKKDAKDDAEIAQVTRDMGFYYLTQFLAAYEALLALGGSMSVSEIGLNNDYFIVKGSADGRGANGAPVRVYYLRIGIRREERLYVAGYLIPAGDDLQDVKTSMSMISGFKILR